MDGRETVIWCACGGIGARMFHLVSVVLFRQLASRTVSAAAAVADAPLVLFICWFVFIFNAFHTFSCGYEARKQGVPHFHCFVSPPLVPRTTSLSRRRAKPSRLFCQIISDRIHWGNKHQVGGSQAKQLWDNAYIWFDVGYNLSEQLMTRQSHIMHTLSNEKLLYSRKRNYLARKRPRRFIERIIPQTKLEK